MYLINWQGELFVFFFGHLWILECSSHLALPENQQDIEFENAEWNCCPQSSVSEGYCSLIPQSCPTLCGPLDCSPPGSSAQGIFPARILEWVAIFSSRVSTKPRDQTCISCIGRRILYHWATWEAVSESTIGHVTLNFDDMGLGVVFQLIMAIVMLLNNQPQNLSKPNVGIWVIRLGIDWRLAVQIGLHWGNLILLCVSYLPPGFSEPV